jgi:hypothetical protein
MPKMQASGWGRGKAGAQQGQCPENREFPCCTDLV